MAVTKTQAQTFQGTTVYHDLEICTCIHVTCYIFFARLFIKKYATYTAQNSTQCNNLLISILNAFQLHCLQERVIQFSFFIHAFGATLFSILFTIAFFSKLECSIEPKKSLTFKATPTTHSSSSIKKLIACSYYITRYRYLNFFPPSEAHLSDLREKIQTRDWHDIPPNFTTQSHTSQLNFI